MVLKIVGFLHCSTNRLPSATGSSSAVVNNNRSGTNATLRTATHTTKLNSNSLLSSKPAVSEHTKPRQPTTVPGSTKISLIPSKNLASLSAGAAPSESADKPSGPVNGDECYFWRTTGCQFAEACRYRHVQAHKGIDKKPWQIVK